MVSRDAASIGFVMVIFILQYLRAMSIYNQTRRYDIPGANDILTL
jgi:hypothetical protein